MRILLTGKDGQVGWELRRSLAVLGEVRALGRRELDMEQPDAIRAAIRAEKPDVIVNAAAYTAVDRAESEEECAIRINGIAPGVLAEESRRCGALLVHYSTDYVFDGTAKTPYSETDAANPINAYGRSKLTGERAIAAAAGRWIVLRTSWVYSARGSNFLLTMLRLGRERDRLHIVNDQVGAPTWSRNIADATAQLLRVAAGERNCARLLHLCADGSASWYDFAVAIFELVGGSMLAKAPALEAIPSEHYPLPAARPRNSRLSTEALRKNFGLALPPWRDALDMCLEELAQRGAH